MPTLRDRWLSWAPAYLEVVAAVYLLCGSEWLFQVTKASFLSVLTWGESLRVLLVSPLYLVVPLLMAQTGVLLLQAGLHSSSRVRLPAMTAVIPGAVHAVTALLLIDNFTYTVFGVGIVSLAGMGRAAAAGLWMALFGVIVWWRSGAMASWDPHGSGSSGGRYAALVVLLAAALVAGWEWMSGAPTDVSVPGIETRREGLPDILFLSMDAMAAEQTSLFGYERETTPALDALSKSALVFENAYSNNCYTTGALMGLLAGKRSTDVRVFYPPMTLRGADAYEHLPGILRKLGYRSTQIAARYWASALWQGMRNAFDWVNGSDTRAQDLRFLPAAVADRLPLQRYFLIQTRGRIMERAEHLAGVRDMVRYMDIVRNVATKESMTDEQRKDALLRFLAENDAGPVFAQVHFMTGHCCIYRIPERHRHFTLDGGGIGVSTNHYDDAIRTMDALLGDILDWLEEAGRLENTLIVVTSDHTKKWESEGRVPLLIRFPGGARKGRVTANVQLADVAPTVLDYLGLPVPPWMTGQSLLHEAELDRLRPIITASGVEKTPYRMPKPPLYGLTAVSAMICDRWYRLGLDDRTLTSGPVAGHTAACSPDMFPSDAEVESLLTRHLVERGIGLSGE